ncbi:permease [Aliiroseovarius crassostreae]|uniref:permease n=1 Tax=Aliiroseovarius crassostreae TaxID=154981 RepID=UPI00220C0B57|nr:permease [Aliiroseovarius crassostreae]UWQ08989.1 permease [Aliiroseovarius crassostreae]
MSNNKPLKADAEAMDYFEIANGLFNRVLNELERQLRASEEGMSEGECGLAKTSTELRKALQTVFDERKRLEQTSKTAGQGAAGTSLNLAQARDEIGRRLACLRDVRRARGLPEQPD